MKELILWKEVDVKEVPSALLTPGFHEKYICSNNKWLKRVVINILSDQEIKHASILNDDLTNMSEKGGFMKGYKLSQERLIGGEGL